MKQMLVLLILMLIAGLLLGSWLINDAGYLLIIRGGWQLEATLGFALFGAILLITLTAMSTLLLASAWDLITPFNATGRWRIYRARQRMESGFYALVEGRWQKAERNLAAASRVPQWQVMASLGAAQAAAELGCEEAAREYLEQAHQHKRGRLAAGLMAAKIALDEGYPGDARNELNRLRDVAPKNPRLIRMLGDAFEKSGDWESLCALLPQLRKCSMNQKTVDTLERRAWHGWLKQVADSVNVESSAVRIKALRVIWKSMPQSMQSDASLRAQYAGYLAQLGDGEAALRVVQKNLDKNWDDRLPATLECINNVAPERLLILLEGWLEERPDNAVLLLTAGRVAMRAQLWGKARSFFEASGRAGNSVALAELARLLNALGDQPKAMTVLDERLQLIESALPLLPLPSRAVSKE